MEQKSAEVNVRVTAMHRITGIRTEGFFPHGSRCSLTQGNVIIRYPQEVL